MLESPDSLYKREWTFNKEMRSAPPSFGVCFSGGGNRSAAFAIGVLAALHDLGLLSKVDVMSAVSGGGYALSWFLLQPFYDSACVSDPKAALPQVQNEMFDVRGPFQCYLVDHAKPLQSLLRAQWIQMLLFSLVFDATLFNIARLPVVPFQATATFANLLNVSWSRLSYREGIQNTYQVFPDLMKKVHAKESSTLWGIAFQNSQHLRLTLDKVPPVTFPALSAFAQRAALPSFVLNTTVVPPKPHEDVKLKDRIFELGSMGFGSDSCGYLAWEDTDNQGWEPGTPVDRGWAWKDVTASPYATIRNFNVASAISGASFDASNTENWKLQWLVRLANIGLAYVVPNPANPRRVVRLSDGGHSENLGLYALLRRRCRTILIVDAEYDPAYRFGAYRKIKKAASNELHIELNVPSVEKILGGANTFNPNAPIMEGTTSLAPDSKVFYLKLSMHDALLGDQATFIKPYAETHETFPQETTVDQYFDPDRFIAYRALGYAIARTLGRDIP
jgi:Patatin-like phospholipase